MIPSLMAWVVDLSNLVIPWLYFRYGHSPSKVNTNVVYPWKENLYNLLYKQAIVNTLPK